jgi:hypothetical protein
MTEELNGSLRPKIHVKGAVGSKVPYTSLMETKKFNLQNSSINRVLVEQPSHEKFKSKKTYFYPYEAKLDNLTDSSIDGDNAADSFAYPKTNFNCFYDRHFRLNKNMLSRNLIAHNEGREKIENNHPKP